MILAFYSLLNDAAIHPGIWILQSSGVSGEDAGNSPRCTRSLIRYATTPVTITNATAKSVLRKHLHYRCWATLGHMKQGVISKQAGLLCWTIPIHLQENSPRVLLSSIVIYLEKQRGITKQTRSSDLLDRLTSTRTYIKTQNDHGRE